MRVIAATDDIRPRSIRTRPNARAMNVELLGLAACSIAVLLGVTLTWWGRTARLRADGPDPGSVIQLRAIGRAASLEPALTMFQQPFERQAVARALFARAAGMPPLEHVGGLSTVAIPAADVRKEPRFVELNGRLGRRPDLTHVPVLGAADLAAFKPRVAVRTERAYGRQLLGAITAFLGAFWAAHLVRRWRGTDDDPLMLPVLLLLSGLGLMGMIALRDPLRDMLIARAFAVGVVAGLGVLLVVSEIDFEASRLRRMVLSPLAAAFALAALLLVFGSGPGSSGAKVNVAGFQPVEVIRLLVILALAAYFARRLDLFRELSVRPAADNAWLRWIRVPRWKDAGPVVVSMGLVLVFFFLQKDLGPALVMSCVFLGLYGIARGRVAAVVLGLAIIGAGFAVAYAIGSPATVRHRVLIWSDPWNNGVAGGNQIAHGLWALATGGLWGLGQGLGSPQAIPAGHTDFVLAVLGEELGFVGVAVVVLLYGLLCWRCLRIAVRAPGDYTAFLAAGVALVLMVQALVIAGGMLGLVPLSGVVTPFLSYGKSSMLANCAAVGVVMAVARRKGIVRAHLQRPVRVIAVVLAAAGAAVAARAMWIQVPRADEYAARSSVGVQADGGYRFEYNPRLLAAARQIPRGSIYDRRGLAIATSRPGEMAAVGDVYRKAGIAATDPCDAESPRCYPLGGSGFHVLGDWRTQANWAAGNSSYLERDRAARLQGYDDRPKIVEVRNPRTGAREKAMSRDYRDLLAFARTRYRPGSGAARAVLGRNRDLHTSLDAGMQLRAAAALRRRIEAGRHDRGAAVVLDTHTGEILAAVSYPWPGGQDGQPDAADVEDGEGDRLLDRTRYGLYAPGSVFKLVVAGAALRHHDDGTFACVRLPDGRVGNRVRGASRPVRDDPLDTHPHGAVDLRRGLVVSCNAYFAQLASRIGPRPVLEASAFFQIDPARTPTDAGLAGTLPHAGYGQGEVLVSPLKMARVAAAIADGGLVHPARWDRDDAGILRPQRFLSAGQAAQLARYMREVVTSGTGRALQSNPIPIAGKTGTAEVANGRAHSWFVGFAPYGGGGRRIAFAVLVENAGYGAHTAAPIAGEIVTAARDAGLFDKGR